MLGRRFFLGACLVAAACSSAPAEQAAGKAAPPPVGARVESSGFWTVDRAPESPAPPSAARTGLENELTFYAQLAGVSNEEAAKRMKEQERTRPEFKRLMRTLRDRERGNYTDAELIHRPDWAYLIYFKRNPRATLARYTKNSRFQARSAQYTHSELERLTRPWIDRQRRTPDDGIWNEPASRYRRHQHGGEPQGI